MEGRWGYRLVQHHGFLAGLGMTVRERSVGVRMIRSLGPGIPSKARKNDEAYVQVERGLGGGDRGREGGNAAE